MTRQEAVAREMLLRDPALHADMLANLGKPDAQLLVAAPEGVILAVDRWMLSVAGGPAILPALLPRIDDAVEVILVRDEALIAPVQATGRYANVHVFKQALYDSQTPLPVALPPDTEIRPLSEADIPVVAENYHTFSIGDTYAAERVRAGVMLGAFVDGRLAGFMGLHGERSMGLLVVLPAYRRRHLAEALERSLINLQLARGELPFGQVNPDNDASLALQAKLGLRISAGDLYWLY